MKLEQVIKEIRPIDKDAMEQSWVHWDTLCKPLRGFGKLEEMVVQMAGIQGTPNPKTEKRAVVIMGADNGVVEEGVSQTGQEVTLQVLENMGQRITSVCVMSRLINAEIIPVNIGAVKDGKHPDIRNISVRHGTDNIRKGPAMTREECITAIERGIEVVGKLKEQGYDTILVGEMGIGNTTTSSACISVFFDQDPDDVTGRGAGLSSAALVKKVQVIRDAIAVNKPDKNDVIDVISKVGGLDIAGMAGCFLGAAYYHMTALIDGLISCVSAYAALQLCENCRGYMIPTHSTAEPAGKAVMKGLGMEPILYAGMHLGEATGAAAVLPLIDQALNVYYGLPSFANANVEQYKHLK